MSKVPLPRNGMAAIPKNTNNLFYHTETNNKSPLFIPQPDQFDKELFRLIIRLVVVTPQLNGLEVKSKRPQSCLNTNPQHL